MSTSLALIPPADKSQLNRNAAFRDLREMVLNSVASEHSKRNYVHRVSRALLMEYRPAMLEKKLSASTVNVRLSAIRKLVGEAQRNGILDAEQAAKMTDVPNLRQQGDAVGELADVSMAYRVNGLANRCGELSIFIFLKGHALLDRGDPSHTQQSIFEVSPYTPSQNRRYTIGSRKVSISPNARERRRNLNLIFLPSGYFQNNVALFVEDVYVCPSSLFYC